MKRQKYSNVRVNYDIWISDEEGNSILRDHDWLMLNHISKLGSLKAAADQMKISYRKAWGDLKHAETMLGFTLIDKQRGGEQGGKSELTAEGEKFVNSYNQLMGNFQQSVNDYIIDFKKTLKSK